MCVNNDWKNYKPVQYHIRMGTNGPHLALTEIKLLLLQKNQMVYQKIVIHIDNAVPSTVVSEK